MILLNAFLAYALFGTAQIKGLRCGTYFYKTSKPWDFIKNIGKNEEAVFKE